MLETIRKAAGTWVARALLAILALSFVYWGADTRTTNTGTTVIATVGGKSITQSDLERAFENEINAISQRAGRRITQTEARSLGLDKRALTRLIGTTAIDKQAGDLGLAVSEQTAAESITRDPAFHGIDGKFDRSGFNNLLRSIGMSERDFIDLRRREEIRDQITQSVLQSIVTPKPLVKAVHEWREETRVVEHFTLEGEKAVTVAEPDATKLKETYEANKAQFMAPEYRQMQVLLLSVEALKGQMDVPDAEIARSYEETKETYATPELRRVQQISFKDKAAADKARAEIAGGKNFMTVAEEMKLKDTDVELGLINKKALIDPKIADAAFSIGKDKVSDVVEGRFATVIVRVPEIVAGKQPSLEDVKDRVKEKLQREKARGEIKKLRDEVDDLRTAGKSDKEIAEATKLKLIDVAEADASNKTKDGRTALEHPDAAKLIASGFDARTGIERDPVDLTDGGYGWVTTTGTTPARQKPFEEVEGDTKALYVSTERSRLLRELAQKTADRISAGEAIEKVAAEFNAKLEKTEPITRSTSPQGLTEQAVRQAFALALGKAGHSETSDRKGRTVVRVLEIKPAAEPAKEQALKLAAEIGQQIQLDTLDAFVNAVQDAAGVSINEAQLKRALGGADQ